MPATITSAPVPFTPTQKGKIIPQLKGQGVFTDYMIHNRFEKDRQVFMLPITSPKGFLGASAAFVQLASPTLLWICDWTASKLKVQPAIPNPVSNNPRWVLLDDWWEPAQISIAADGLTPLYRISGTFIYGCLNPSALTVKDISFPRPPWLDDVFERLIPATLLTNNLIQPPYKAGGNFGFFV